MNGQQSCVGSQHSRKVDWLRIGYYESINVETLYCDLHEMENAVIIECSCLSITMRKRHSIVATVVPGLRAMLALVVVDSVPRGGGSDTHQVHNHLQAPTYQNPDRRTTVSVADCGLEMILATPRVKRLNPSIRRHQALSDWCDPQTCTK